MLTYSLSKSEGPLYLSLYKCLKEDILKGDIAPGSKLPSKRTLAENLGVSTITVENAYEQLVSEGYVYSLPKRGYFVDESVQGRSPLPALQEDREESPEAEQMLFENKNSVKYDFSSNLASPETFPFSIWTKLIRENMSQNEDRLLSVSPPAGVYELRAAIADHLNSFRGMRVNPDRIVVGAGTEYLYGLLIQLLGRDKVYCIETPGYKKISQIYESNEVEFRFVQMDESGISVAGLEKTFAQIAHISPAHHFPTGITMSLQRRYELLEWAGKDEERYIIEDEYDSEFRLSGRPIPTLKSIDTQGKVIYVNTFSKSLASTVRISYMVLPDTLAQRFYEHLSFYSSTVSTFEQYTLAQFIGRGYFEKHINRMRLFYLRKRKTVLSMLEESFANGECIVLPHDSGLHFLLELKTALSDREVEERLLEKGIRLKAVTDFELAGESRDMHRFILNYSCLDTDGLPGALGQLKSVLDISSAASS